MPYALPYNSRLAQFRKAIDAERYSVQGPAHETFHMLSALTAASSVPRSPGVVVRIRRARVIEDGMKAFNKIGSSVKDRVVVRYVNDFGEEEMGIDSGGLFKDFLTDLTTRIFDPSYVRFYLLI